MKYENFGQVEFVCKAIKEKEALLDNLKAAEEIRFQLPSGFHIKTIQCGMKAETDYELDAAAVDFKNKIIDIITKSIASNKNELVNL